MRAAIALIVIIYVVGVGLVLSPTIQAKWNGASASNLAASRTGSAQRTRVAGRNLRQHDGPWLTAFDGAADRGFGHKEKRDEVGCNSSPGVQK